MSHANPMSNLSTLPASEAGLVEGATMSLVTTDVVSPANPASFPEEAFAQFAPRPQGAEDELWLAIPAACGPGHSDYVALEVGLNRRWSKGVQFQGSYTYSRTRDVQSDPQGRIAAIARGRPGVQRLSDPFSTLQGGFFTRQFDLSADYGLSDFDQRHNLAINFVAEAPKFRGWRRVFGRWQAAALAGFRSGFPFSVLSTELFIPQSGGLLLVNRADFLGQDHDEAFLSNPTQIPGGVVLLDKSKFRAPTDGAIGNAPRNAFRGPGFWNVDFALSRSFALPPLGEQGRLQFRAEFFNLFNHTNLNNPDPALQSSTFGEATFGRQGFGSVLPSVSPLGEQPRRIQFGVKIYF